MRKVRWRRAARAVPLRAGTAASPSTTASSISSREMAPSSARRDRSSGVSGERGTGPSYGREPSGSPARSGARRPSRCSRRARREGRGRGQWHGQRRGRARRCVGPGRCPRRASAAWARRGEQVRRVAVVMVTRSRQPAGSSAIVGKIGDVLPGDLARHDRLLRRLRQRVHRAAASARSPSVQSGSGRAAAVDRPARPTTAARCRPTARPPRPWRPARYRSGRGRVQGGVDRPGDHLGRVDGRRGVGQRARARPERHVVEVAGVVRVQGLEPQRQRPGPPLVRLDVARARRPGPRRLCRHRSPRWAPAATGAVVGRHGIAPAAPGGEVVRGRRGGGQRPLGRRRPTRRRSSGCPGAAASSSWTAACARRGARCRTTRAPAPTC